MKKGGCRGDQWKEGSAGVTSAWREGVQRLPVDKGDAKKTSQGGKQHCKEAEPMEMERVGRCQSLPLCSVLPPVLVAAAGQVKTTWSHKGAWRHQGAEEREPGPSCKLNQIQFTLADQLVIGCQRLQCIIAHQLVARFYSTSYSSLVSC